ncbi:DoxX family protein [Flexithrix dorotheae]|uniref:DoxX family protein n=1 Tax=Flexithrix dorotheae TaxID=70993 RepID=UPI0003825A78|nr:DoxX family protein [Flexithrix dorotheae]
MKILYWISTGITAAFLFWSAYTYLFSKNTIAGIKALGFPDFFRVELAVLKLLAAGILLIPLASPQVKEWAYAGVGLFLLTAFIAHLNHKDSIFILVFLLILIGILIVSNLLMNQIMK